MERAPLNGMRKNYRVDWSERTARLWLAVAVAFAFSRTALAQFTPTVATPNSIVLPSGPGSLQGLTDAPNVRLFSGQLTYTVKVEVPAGPAGAKPSIAISYDGALGNGPLGVGWALSVPHIRRSTHQGVPTYDDDIDEIEIVGLEDLPCSRLVRIQTGEYAGEFRVEGEGQRIRVQRDGNVWLVTTGAGTKYYFGLTPAARQTAPDRSRVAAWYVSSVIPITGQTINYAYDSHLGALYPTSISWGPLVSMPLSETTPTPDDAQERAFAVQLQYKEREDVQTSHRTGFSVETSKRVDRVVVRSFGRVLRTYDMSYSDAFAVSRLVGVDITGLDGKGSLPSQTFSYVPSAATEMFSVDGAGGWSLSNPSVALADLDADGLADLVRFGWGEHLFRKNLGGTFAEAVSIAGAEVLSLGDGTARLIDVDGDKRLELVSRDLEGWYFHRYYGGVTWQPTERWGGSKYVWLDGSVALCDINGDGQIDAVSPTVAGLVTRLGEDGGFGERLPADGSVPVDMDSLIFTDVNGDAMADVVSVGIGAYYAYLGYGDGTFGARHSLGLTWTLGEARQTELLDINRDGLVDVVHVDGSGVVVWRARRADGTFAEGVRVGKPEGLDYGVVAFGDVNGNGSTDVVWSAIGGGAIWASDLSGGGQAGLLETVSNGIGQVLTAKYSSSGELSVLAERRGESWGSTLPMSVPVPARVARDVGDGSLERVATYDVRNGFWDPWERRFAGFLGTRAVEEGDGPAETLVTDTTFHAGIGRSRVLRGKTLVVQRRGLGGKVYDVTRTTWGLKQNPDLPGDPLIFVPIKERVQTKIFEGETDPIVTATAYEDHDEDGRPATIREFGRVDDERDDVVKHLSYAVNTDTWVRGILTEERIEDGAGNLVRRDRLYYDGDDTSPLPWSEVSMGLLRRTMRYDVENDRWVLVAGKDYDNHGNATRIYEDGYWRTVDYDGLGLHPERETVHPSPTTELVWIGTWNQVTGLLEGVTGPDGETHRVHYDALGRPSSRSIGDYPAHVHYVYDWQAPRPRTRTYSFDRPLDSLSGRETETEPTYWTAEKGWHRVDSVANGAGEPLYQATWLGEQDRTWIIEGFRIRDVRGQVDRFFEPFYSAVANSLDVQEPEDGDTHDFDYDATGRVTTRRLPTGALQEIAYEPLSRTTTGMGLAPKTEELDGHERVVTLSRALEELTEKLDFTYDPENHITSVSIQDGAVTHGYGYDSLGRLRNVTIPETGTTTFTYYDTGWLQTKSNEADHVVTYHYDDIGRVTAQDGDGKRIHDYHYDAARPECGESGMFRTAGRLAWASTPETQELVYFGYDRFGRIGRVSRRIHGEWVTKWTRFGASGRPLRVVTDDGLRVSMRHDAAGRLVQMGDYWQQLETDPSGRALSEQYGNGVLQTYARDAVGLPTAVTLAHAGSLLYDVAATYNDWGGLKTMDDMLPGVGLHNGASYTYDLAARVLSATVGTGDATPYEFTYAYDALNNLTLRSMTRGPALPQSMAPGTYVYGENGYGSRQLTGVEAPAGIDGEVVRALNLEYDNAGRTTREGDRWLEYDALDRLRRVTVPDAGGSGFVLYEYGHDGLRSYVDDPLDTDERWFSDSHQQVGASVRRHYLKLGERLVARVERVRDETCTEGGRGPSIRPECNVWHAGSVQYAHASVTSGPVVLTDGLGAIVEERRYEPFGSPIDADHALEVHGWSDKPYDLTTGYVYHGARWRSTLGTAWLTGDPLLLTGAQLCIESPRECHPYGFAGNDPVNFVDPTGLYMAHHETQRPRDSDFGAVGMSWLGPIADFFDTDRLVKAYHAVGNTAAAKAETLGWMYRTVANMATAGIAGATFGASYGPSPRSMPISAVAPVKKFSHYIFREGADHGKDHVFRGLGYGREHSQTLAKMWERQAAEKFTSGDFSLGKLDQYGQRVNIEIELHGIGEAAGKTSRIKSGWMITGDDSIKLNTPFSGFADK